MKLLSCEHPVRIYNQYTNEYIYVPCGKCNMCRTAKASRWTDALERERLMHRYCFFVTLTYSDACLPKVAFPTFEDFKENIDTLKGSVLVSNRMFDPLSVDFDELMEDCDPADYDLFNGLYDQFSGIPYPCLNDIQYFNKRLNKYFHDNVSKKYKNFRYFIVSEYGSTTLRPHWHGIYFVDRPEVADSFQYAIDSLWKQGLTDCQFVEKSACGYVAQYINKSSDLPLFYQKAPLRTKYVFSRCPTIGQCRFRPEDFIDSDGVMSEHSKDLQEIFDKSAPTHCIRGKGSSSEFVVVPLDKSTQNRLFPKCPSFKYLSDSLRIELYSISCRFTGTFRQFFRKVVDYMRSFVGNLTEFKEFMYHAFFDDYMSGDEDKCKRAFGWLRRLYYLSRKVVRQSCLFKVSLSTYVDRILQYYNNKELYLLSQQYQFQESYEGVSDDLALMYPDYLRDSGYTFKEYLDMVSSPVANQQIADAAYYAYSNKKTHFKNAYLDSLKYKESYQILFNHLINFFYAKKCDEVTQALATSGS